MSSLKKDFCPIPFSQLNFYPNGWVSPCCLIPYETVGNIQDMSIDQMWNSEKMQSLRREFLEGKVTTCRKKIDHFKCNEWFAHLNDKVELKQIIEGPIKRLDLRLNGRCNLECIMCNIWTLPNHVYDNTEFWSYAKEKIFPHMLEVDVLGGEPFIQRDTFRLIDEVSSVNANCEWCFTTNAHWKFDQKIRESLDRIKIQKIVISLDTHDPETYAKIRKLGRWEVVSETTAEIVEYEKSRREVGRGFSVIFDMVVQQENVRDIPGFIRMCDEFNVKSSLIYMNSPRELSVTELSQEKIEDNIVELINTLKWASSTHHDEITKIIRKMLSIPSLIRKKELAFELISHSKSRQYL